MEVVDQEGKDGVSLEVDQRGSTSASDDPCRLKTSDDTYYHELLAEANRRGIPGKCDYKRCLDVHRLFGECKIKPNRPPLECIPNAFGGLPDKFDVVVRRSKPTESFNVGIKLVLFDDLHRQKNIESAGNMVDFVWSEGPLIGHFLTRSAKWLHMNFSVGVGLSPLNLSGVGLSPLNLSEQRYFAEVIEFRCRDEGCAEYKVISCVRIDGNVNLNVHGENSAKCVICDDQIFHPSSELCIADISLMNPYNFKEWIKAGINLSNRLGCDYFLTGRF